MSILVFSDTHLRLPFEVKKYQFLKKIINRAERVIINGDFWDGYIISFEHFLRSAWKGLFPILKAKNTIYIYGNHDKKSLSDKRVDRFSTLQTRQYILPFKNKELLFEHGHQFVRSPDVLFNINAPRRFQAFELRLFDSLVYRFGRRFLQMTTRRYNLRMKKLLKTRIGHRQILVCGHTHYSELDLKQRFINSGMIGGRLGEYLVIDQNKIVLKSQHY